MFRREAAFAYLQPPNCSQYNQGASAPIRPRSHSFLNRAENNRGRNLSANTRIWRRISPVIVFDRSSSELSSNPICAHPPRLVATFRRQVPSCGQRSAISIVYVPSLQKVLLGTRIAFA